MKLLDSTALIHKLSSAELSLPLEQRISTVANRVLPEAAKHAMTDGKRPCRKSHAAGLLTTDGEFVVGVNRKYSHPSLACCAEDCALGALITLGHRQLLAAATYSADYGPGEYPELCGRCRDLLIEYLSDTLSEVLVVMITPHGVKSTTVSGGFCAQPFAGDAERNGKDSSRGTLLAELEQSEWQRFSAACDAGEFDADSLASVREELRRLVSNSTYAHVKDSGVEPEAAAVIDNAGRIYFGVSVRSGNPPFSLTALRVAAGVAVSSGSRQFAAALLHVEHWDKNKDWKLLLDPSDIGRLQRTHLGPQRNRLELFVSVGREMLKRATLLPVTAL